MGTSRNRARQMASRIDSARRAAAQVAHRQQLSVQQLHQQQQEKLSRAVHSPVPGDLRYKSKRNGEHKESQPTAVSRLATDKQLVQDFKQLLHSTVGKPDGVRILVDQSRALASLFHSNPNVTGTVVTVHGDAATVRIAGKFYRIPFKALAIS